MFSKLSILSISILAVVAMAPLAVAAPGVWSAEEVLERSDIVVVATLQDVEWECLDGPSSSRISPSCFFDHGRGRLSLEQVVLGSFAEPTVSIYWRNAVSCPRADYRPLEGRRALWFLRKHVPDGRLPELVIPLDDASQVGTALERLKRAHDQGPDQRIQAIVRVLAAAKPSS